LEQPVTSFAYPYGAHSGETVAIVRDSGFACACATIAGPVQRGADLFQLPRVAAEDWGGEEFRQRLAAWFEGFEGGIL
jgi:hypothetical protein